MSINILGYSVYIQYKQNKIKISPRYFFKIYLIIKIDKISKTRKDIDIVLNYIIQI